MTDDRFGAFVEELGEGNENKKYRELQKDNRQLKQKLKRCSQQKKQLEGFIRDLNEDNELLAQILERCLLKDHDFVYNVLQALGVDSERIEEIL